MSLTFHARIFAFKKEGAFIFKNIFLTPENNIFRFLYNNKNTILDVSRNSTFSPIQRSRRFSLIRTLNLED
jgi:hypothetical protein